MGVAGHQNRFPGGQQILTSRGGVRLTACPTWAVHQHRRVAVAVFPQGAANNDERPPTTPAPSTLPEELLLARFVLVRRDGAQPPLSPIYDGPTECWSGQPASSCSRWGIEPTR
ncbi:MAG: hypothetical protein ACK559_24380, partial [bacterium]